MARQAPTLQRLDAGRWRADDHTRFLVRISESTISANLSLTRAQPITYNSPDMDITDIRGGTLRLLRALGVTFFALLLVSPRANGANITWDSPQQITGDTDVSTTGTLLGAFNVGDTGVPSTMVNGVNFQSFAAPGGVGMSGNFSMTSGGFGVFNSNTSGASANAPFTTLTSQYQTLLSSYVTPLFGPVTLTMSGLMIGKQYQFEFWSNLSSQMFGYQITATGGINAVSLSSNTGSADGGLGQFVTGTFTADALTQDVSFLGDGDGGFLNAFQLRQLGASGVPETGSTFGLLAGALVGVAVLRWKLA